MTDARETEAVAAFAGTYAEARDKFLAAAAAQGIAVDTVAHPRLRGAEGETLATDFALVGLPEASALLLLSSGTHGAEGFCGSGCQVALLRDDTFVEAVHDAGIAVLMIHAVNPYGFSHLRRVNEDNVDLNRNFRDFDLPPPDNDAYAELHALLLPEVWPPTAGNTAALGARVALHGMRAFQAALTGGQYAFPDGLFFGGTRPTWSNRVVRDALARYGSDRARLAWIDFHTGLGPTGHGEKIWAGHDRPEDLARAHDWWGPDVTSFHDGSSTSAVVVGALYTAAYDACPRAEYTGIALEYGTRPLEEIFAALRGDHWLHNHPDAPPALRAHLKQALRDVFYVDTPAWKATVLEQARHATLAAVHALGHAQEAYGHA